MKSEVLRGEFNLTPISSVIFGVGSIERLKEKVEELGCKRALVITVPPIADNTDFVKRTKKILGGRFAGVFSQVVQHVPRQCVIEGAKVARKVGADVLISLGGSSTADAAKGINLVLAEANEPADFFTAFDKGVFTLPQGYLATEFRKPKLPQISIPTTLSGGEFTGSVGITDIKRKQKDLARDPKITPKVIILDPELTVFTDNVLWSSTALKTMSDCFAGICSPRHQPFSDALGLHAIRLMNSYLLPSLSKPINLEARAMLQHAVWIAIYGLWPIGGGIVAALRHQIGGIYNIGHGIASVIIFKPAISFDRPETDNRLALIAKTMELPFKDAADGANAAINRVTELISKSGLPAKLSDAGIPRDGINLIADATLKDYQITKSVKPVSREQVIRILESAY